MMLGVNLSHFSDICRSLFAFGRNGGIPGLKSGHDKSRQPPSRRFHLFVIRLLFFQELTA